VSYTHLHRFGYLGLALSVSEFFSAKGLTFVKPGAVLLQLIYRIHLFRIIESVFIYLYTERSSPATCVGQKWYFVCVNIYHDLNFWI